MLALLSRSTSVRELEFYEYILSYVCQLRPTENYGYTRVLDGAGYPPLDREGAAYGNVGGTKIYFAGGVNTIYPSPSYFTAFTDIYTYDTRTRSFYLNLSFACVAP